MAYASINVISKHSGQLVKLWNSFEAAELHSLKYLLDNRMMGRFYKVYDPDNSDLRTNMGGKWRICSNGYCITTKSSEADADTFIRKMKAAINIHEDFKGSVMRMEDI